MGFKTLEEISGRAFYGAGTRIRTDPDKKTLRIGVTKNASGNKCIWNFVVYISAALAKDARYLPSDRLMISIDEEARLGLVSRVRTGGVCFSVNQKTLSKSAEKEQYCPGKIQTGYTLGMPFARPTIECGNVSVGDDGIMFEIPADVPFDVPKEYLAIAKG